jgi:hypothetical protein
MEAMMLRGLVAVESAPASFPAAPEPAVRRTYPGAPQCDVSLELTPLQRPTTLPEPGHNSGIGLVRDDLPDIEMSRPVTPAAGTEGVDTVETIWNPYRNRFRLLAVCFINFGNGLNDSALGALLPYLEE